jgi:hypothetical protein
MTAADRAPVVKPVDGLYATHVAGPIAFRIVGRWVDAPITPNQVTALSFLAIALAALAAARGTFPGNLLAILLLQASFVLDMVDGQLARARGAGSAYGAYLDEVSDRVGEALLYAGIAFGAAVARPEVWPLAYGAIAAVLLRHVGDLALLVRFRVDPAGERALHEDGWLTRSIRSAGVEDGRQQAGWLGAAKTALWLSIGDRFALLSLALLAMRPDLYFWVILLVGAPSWLARIVQKTRRLR